MFAVATYLTAETLTQIDRTTVVEVIFKVPPLIPGEYNLDIGLSDGPSSFIDAIYSASSFEVYGDNYLGTTVDNFTEMGAIMVQSRWCTKEGSL